MRLPPLLPAGLRPHLLFLALTVAAGAAQAQGVVIRPDFRPAELELRRHRVEADVQESVAVVTVEHEFYNPGGSTVEGTFLFPLPAGAQPSRFSMEVDGKEMKGELLEAEEARRIYEDIVRRSLDPALLEMADYRTFRARVFPIPPRATRRITLRYDATLAREGELVSFRYPMQGALATRHAGGAPPPAFAPRRGPAEPADGPKRAARGSTIEIRLAAGEAIKNVYSPSHRVEVQRSGDRRAVVRWEADEPLDGRDFLLYYTLDRNPIGATLLAHRPYGDRDGFFLLLLSPSVEIPDRAVQGRDVVFVLDVSGSMAGEKIEQAKGALRYALERLGSRDRFGIVSFSTEAERFRDRLVPVASRDDALHFVDRIEAQGGTNIHAALLSALKMLEGGRPGAMVVFLTDGLPSVGVQDEAEIRQSVLKANRDRVRLFSFGVGYDVNTRLLDGLSAAAGAFADYVSPDEDIEAKVAAFYEKVRYPVLTDLALEWEGADVRMLSPARPGDLYRGGQILLAGRYGRSGLATLTLTGRADGAEQRFTYALRFPERERDREFVARLWATRRVGDLLDAIRMHGENPELKDEVVRLAKSYGLVTPYTAYLVREEEVPLQAGASPRFRSGGAPPPSAASAPALEAVTGADAVGMSRAIRAMQDAGQVAGPGSATSVHVGGRLLTRASPEAPWTDAEYRPGSPVLKIRFASDDYFAFLRRHPEARPFARLGSRVLFRLGDRWVEFGE